MCTTGQQQEADSISANGARKQLDDGAVMLRLSDSENTQLTALSLGFSVVELIGQNTLVLSEDLLWSKCSGVNRNSQTALFAQHQTLTRGYHWLQHQDMRHGIGHPLRNSRF